MWRAFRPANFYLAWYALVLLLALDYALDGFPVLPLPVKLQFALLFLVVVAYNTYAAYASDSIERRTGLSGVVQFLAVTLISAIESAMMVWPAAILVAIVLYTGPYGFAVILAVVACVVFYDKFFSAERFDLVYEFECEHLAPTPGELDEEHEDFINEGRFGKTLAEMVAEGLRERGYDIPYLAAEDWGVCIEVALGNGKTATIGCGNVSDTEHIVFVDGRWRKEPDRMAIQRIADDVRDVLENADGITGLQVQKEDDA